MTTYKNIIDFNQEYLLVRRNIPNHGQIETPAVLDGKNANKMQMEASGEEIENSGRP